MTDTITPISWAVRFVLLSFSLSGALVVVVWVVVVVEEDVVVVVVVVVVVRIVVVVVVVDVEVVAEVVVVVVPDTVRMSLRSPFRFLRSRLHCLRSGFR